jgi:hypothetical protein
MIASKDGIDSDELQRAIDGCVSDADDVRSPILRVT